MSNKIVDEKPTLKNEEKPKIEEKPNTNIINQEVPLFDDINDNLLYNLSKYTLLVNKLDNYANGIPLGAFCYSISFILYGFYESKINKKEDNFLKIILLLFGGIGQIISGIFEYIKGRTFPSNLYLIYGTYFFSFYLAKNSSFFKDEPNIVNIKCRAFFYGSWAALTFPLCIGSIQTNLFFLLQTLVGCGFFVVRCIGESLEIDKMKDIIPGILQIVTGFLSLYICITQIINEMIRFQLIPSIPLQNENEVDFFRPNSNNS